MEWTLSATSWKLFLDAALEGGAGLAYRLSKPTPLQQHKTATGGAHHPSSLLKDQVDIWTNFSKCKDSSAQSPTLSNLDQTNNTHDITAQSIRAASASFKPRTSVVDGISPRQFANISDHGLNALATILWICEKNVTFGTTLADLAVRLLLKTDGGRRSIALFRALF
jgi:hypothetical protein